MARPDCRECPSLDPNMRFDPRYPDYCPFGPAGSIKLLGNICPYELGVEEFRRRCCNFALYIPGTNLSALNLPCLAGREWQEKTISGRITCIVEKLEDVGHCYAFNRPARLYLPPKIYLPPN